MGKNGERGGYVAQQGKLEKPRGRQQERDTKKKDSK